jgi:hypothetical protein
MLKKPEGFNMNNRRCDRWMDTTHTSTPTGLNAYVKMELFITNTMIMIAMDLRKKICLIDNYIQPLSGFGCNLFRQPHG